MENPTTLRVVRTILAFSAAREGGIRLQVSGFRFFLMPVLI